MYMMQCALCPSKLAIFPLLLILTSVLRATLSIAMEGFQLTSYGCAEAPRSDSGDILYHSSCLFFWGNEHEIYKKNIIYTYI